MLPAISVNKGVAAFKLLQPHQTVRPEANQHGDKPGLSQALQPSQWGTLRGLRLRNHRILAPDSWGAYQKKDSHESRHLHFPIHRKLLNSFSSFNSHLLMLQLPGLCYKNSDMCWLLPYLFRAVPWSYLRGCVSGLSPQFCSPNKT